MAPKPPVRWAWHTIDTLDTRTLVTLLKLRVDVFVVEQACAYPEIDEKDLASDTLHLLGYAGPHLVAYARAMPEARQLRIGRVLVHSNERGKGIASELMSRMIEHLQRQYPNRPLVLAAQTEAMAFYQGAGFMPVSAPYLEDGIEHRDMRREADGADRLND